MRRISFDLVRLWHRLRSGNAPRVAAFTWRPNWRETNFGDALAPVVVGAKLARRGKSLADPAAARRTLFSIGSVLHYARNDDVIWGSGVNGRMLGRPLAARRLDVRAVRGPLTQDYLRKRGIAAPGVFGDPALLLPLLRGDRRAAYPSRPHVIVPNLFDLPATAGMQNVLSPLLAWQQVLNAILQSRLVVGSSLHAIVVAEAYGIPAQYVHLSEHEHPLKYEDYALGTGRPRLEAARSVAEALEMGGMPPLVFDPEPLMAAFPYDLWLPTEPE